jgi:hypothetical protein
MSYLILIRARSFVHKSRTRFYRKTMPPRASDVTLTRSLTTHWSRFLLVFILNLNKSLVDPRTISAINCISVEWNCPLGTRISTRVHFHCYECAAVLWFMRADIPYRIPVKLSVRIPIDANKRKRMNESSQSDFIARSSFVRPSHYSNFLLVSCFDVSTARVRACLIRRTLGGTFSKLHHVRCHRFISTDRTSNPWIQHESRPTRETSFPLEGKLGLNIF